MAAVKSIFATDGNQMNTDKAGRRKLTQRRKGAEKTKIESSLRLCASA
jgi:hypothetical protein